jgi:signal transduction histidine kinase
LPVLLVSAGAAEMYLMHYHGRSGTSILAAPLIMIAPYSWAGAENLALTAFGALAIAGGDASRNRRAYLAEVEERARRAEHDREQQTLRRITDERLRIARDLHDALGHHLALINVQAGVTAYVLDDQPTQVTQAFRGSGLRVEHDVRGTIRRLASAADVTAYRVIQESLTNVCKHAAGTPARLCLECQPTRLRITVDNEGPAAVGQPRSPGGADARPGIVGMTDRVTAIGGSLYAGNRPGSGFRVRATLPVDGSHV